jgi:hypothetical protein
MHKIIGFAKDVLGVTLYPAQAGELSAYYESGKANWLLLACFEAVVPDFGDIQREGEDRYILIASTRQENARLHIKSIARLLKHTRDIGRMIVKQTEDTIELNNGAVILSLPASARAGRGFTASCVILDELAHFMDTLGNSSADAVYDALSPTVATFGDRARVVITTTPAARQGIVYDLFDRSGSGELEDYYTTQLSTEALNPRVSAKVIANALKRDPEGARTEYYAEFADPIAAYFNSDLLDAAIDYRQQRGDRATAGQRYFMAIDPATMGDRYGFVICHKVDKAVMLDYAQAMRAPVDPNAAEDLLFDLVERWKPVKVRCDTASTVQRLKDKMPELEYTPFSRPMKLRIYGALKEAVNLGNLVLYPEADLVEELKALQIRNGVDIAAPRSGRVKHDDLADCLALCVDALVGGECGEAKSMPNLFYDYYPAGAKFTNEGEDDFLHFPDGSHEYIGDLGNAQRRKLRAKVKKLEEQGYYAAERALEERAKTEILEYGISEDELRAKFARKRDLPNPERDRARATVERVWDTFKNKELIK